MQGERGPGPSAFIYCLILLTVFSLTSNILNCSSVLKNIEGGFVCFYSSHKTGFWNQACLNNATIQQLSVKVFGTLIKILAIEHCGGFKHWLGIYKYIQTAAKDDEGHFCRGAWGVWLCGRLDRSIWGGRRSLDVYAEMPGSSQRLEKGFVVFFVKQRWSWGSHSALMHGRVEGNPSGVGWRSAIGKECCCSVSSHKHDPSRSSDCFRWLPMIKPADDPNDLEAPLKGKTCSASWLV